MFVIAIRCVTLQGYGCRPGSKVAPATCVSGVQSTRRDAIELLAGISSRAPGHGYASQNKIVKLAHCLYSPYPFDYHTLLLLDSRSLDSLLFLLLISPHLAVLPQVRPPACKHLLVTCLFQFATSYHTYYLTYCILSSTSSVSCNLFTPSSSRVRRRSCSHSPVVI